MNDWITVATFTYPHQSAILKGRLESEGIQCFIKDENIVNANPFYSNAVGGVKVQVRENDAERASEIVKDYFYNVNSEDEFEPEPPVVYKPEDPEISPQEKIKCPFCGSTEVNRDKTPSRINIILVLLLGIPLLFPGRKKYHCFNCGADFKKNEINQKL